MNKSIKVLKKPLSLRALKRQVTFCKTPKNLKYRTARIDVNIKINLSDLIDNDINELNDLVDELVLDLNTVSGSLSDINYRVVGHVRENLKSGYIGGGVILNVNADVSDLVEEENA